MTSIQDPLRFIGLCGFLGFPDDWDAVFQALSRTYTSNHVDISTHFSALSWETLLSPPADMPADTQEKPSAATDLAHIIAHLEMQVDHNTVLLGYSMGARLALYACLYADIRPRALVLISANAGILDADERRKRARIDQERVKQLRENPQDFIRTWMQEPIFRPLAALPISAFITEKRLARLDTMPIHAKALETCGPAVMPAFWDHLHTLPCPTLWLAGDLDHPYLQAQTEIKTLMQAAQAVQTVLDENAQKDTARSIQPSHPHQFSVVNRAGHSLLHENPIAVADAIRAFCSSLSLTHQPAAPASRSFGSFDEENTAL